MDEKSTSDGERLSDINYTVLTKHAAAVLFTQCVFTTDSHARGILLKSVALQCD